jgi:AbrB family looped-hinge helix DNA binding protein
MTLVTVKSRFQVTIPSQLRESARLREGDILEATLVEGGILLRPKALVDRDAVAEALETLMEGSPTVAEDRGKSEDDIMSEAIGEVARTRASRRKPTS